MAVTFIGDVHGWADRLETVLARASGPLVFMGDLIDRGAQVPAVLDRVHDLCDRGVARCLLGNHEWMLTRCLGRGKRAPDPEAFAAWVEDWGGDAVLAAYGARTAGELATALGRHRGWLANLPWVLEGEEDGRRWIAVHAGLDHQRPLAEQLKELRQGWDGPWRDTPDPRPAPLFSKQRVRSLPPDLPAEACVVSGHTPLWEPLVTGHRIICDTSGGQPARLLSAVVFPAGRIITSRP